MPQLKSISDLNETRRRLRSSRTGTGTTVTVCGGTGCQASRCQAVVDAVKTEIKKQKLGKKVTVRVTGCHGFCEQGPLMVLEPGNIFYCHLNPEDAPEIVSRTLLKGDVIERLLYSDPVTLQKIKTEAEIPFYRAQDRQLLAQNSKIDPCSIEDYLDTGGYSALAKTFAELTPEAVIDKIKASGLRGRGERFPHCPQVDGMPFHSGGRKVRNL